MSPTRIAAILLVALASCKAREGERCLCADDCRDGLVCVVSGAALQNGECAPEGQSVAGKCVDEDDVPDDGAGGDGEGDGPPPDPDPSRRDFEPQPPDTDGGTTGDSGTTTGTTGTTSTGSTSATTTGTTSTGSTGTTRTGTTSTGSVSATTTGTTSTGSAARGS